MICESVFFLSLHHCCVYFDWVDTQRHSVIHIFLSLTSWNVLQNGSDAEQRPALSVMIMLWTSALFLSLMSFWCDNVPFCLDARLLVFHVLADVYPKQRNVNE